MIKKIPCKTCGKVFLPKSDNNLFCERKCFKKDYYHRKKAENLAAQKFPDFLCPTCGGSIRLDFDPSQDTMQWLDFLCPTCSTLMINVSEEIITQDLPMT